jgi:hypothetical protein
MGDLIKGELYDGTMESLERMVKNLKLEDEVYHFDVVTKEFFIHKLGIIYRPGNYYQYPISEDKIE